MRRIDTKHNLESYPPPPSSSNTHKKPNPTLICTRNLVIVLGVVLLICVLLHLILRHLIKKKRLSNSQQQSSRFQETNNTDDVAYERQLQQLFTLHDSGLDQAFIDALPVFLYKELMGLHEPFDCAVCLCEFSQHDKLRLLPLCSHAFHVNCIDTWLLSNSTCPLCRGALVSPAETESSMLDYQFDDLHEEEDDDDNLKKRVFPVRLGKFRATNGDEKEVGETSNSNMNIDARRCFSMGSYEYVVGKSELQLVFCLDDKGNFGKKDKGISAVDGGNDGKKISSTIKGESFSVSKIWLWSKTDQHKFQDSSSFNVGLPPRSSNDSKLPD